MARSKEQVEESIDFLIQLEQKHQNTPQEVRLRMLRLLKENPSRTFNDVGALTGCSERTIQRWWATYQEDGIEGLIDVKPRGGKKPKRIGPPELQALQQKTRIDGFSKLQEAQVWLHEQHGIRYSRSGMWNLLRTTLKAEPGGWDIPNDEPSFTEHPDNQADQPALVKVREPLAPSPASVVPQQEAMPGSSTLPSHILRFLNGLPTSNDVFEWVAQFRELLRELLGDIDRVSLNVNVNALLDSEEGEEYHPDTVISHVLVESTTSEGSVAMLSAQADARPSTRMLENLRRQGYPLHLYQEPHCYDYYHVNGKYLGTMMLFQKAEHPPISEETLSMVSALKPFLIFALSDIIARHRSNKPTDRAFYDAVGEMTAEADLSKQEKRIVIHRLMGQSYKDLADNLHVSVDTVKKHLSQIHKKTQTNGMAELFGKYFSARLFPKEIKD